MSYTTKKCELFTYHFRKGTWQLNYTWCFTGWL